jgi:hypothetical protein
MLSLLNRSQQKPSITVILCAYNRPHFLSEQIAAIKSQSVPVSDIWLWYNQGSGPQITVPDIKVAYCNHNFKFFGRFAFAMLAQTEYIALFDDDTIPGPNWLEHCLSYMKTHPGILGTTGIQLKKKTYTGHIKIGWNGSHGPNDTIKPVDLIGHAWFLKKEWLKYMWYEDPISWENGEDIHLSYSVKKFANIPSYVVPHPKDDLSVWGSTKGSDYGSDEHASWKKQPNKHINLRSKIVKDLIKRNWTPLFLEPSK